MLHTQLQFYKLRKKPQKKNHQGKKTYDKKNTE